MCYKFVQVSYKNVIASKLKLKDTMFEDLEKNKPKTLVSNIMCLTLILFIFACSEYFLGIFYMNINKIKHPFENHLCIKFNFPLL